VSVSLCVLSVCRWGMGGLCGVCVGVCVCVCCGGVCGVWCVWVLCVCGVWRVVFASGAQKWYQGRWCVV